MEALQILTDTVTGHVVNKRRPWTHYTSILLVKKLHQRALQTCAASNCSRYGQNNVGLDTRTTAGMRCNPGAGVVCELGPRVHVCSNKLCAATTAENKNALHVYTCVWGAWASRRPSILRVGWNWPDALGDGVSASL